MEIDETPIHVMLQYNGVTEHRAAHLDSPVSLLPEAFGVLGDLLSFWSELGWGSRGHTNNGRFRPT
ncbi:jg3488, partial [Pararge aegeria aegeria]